MMDTMEEARVCAIADALRPGDRVLINDRSRPIEVILRELQHHSGVLKTTDYPYRIVWLQGNGTDYRLRYSHLGKYYPRLTTKSQRKTRESWSIRDQEMQTKTIVTERGRTVRRISVRGVDDMSDFVLSRNVEMVE